MSVYNKKRSIGLAILLLSEQTVWYLAMINICNNTENLNRQSIDCNTVEILIVHSMNNNCIKSNVKIVL